EPIREQKRQEEQATIIHGVPPRLVMEIEVDQVPVPDEPGEADAAEGQRDVKNLGPDPMIRLEPALKSVEEDDDCSGGRQDACDLEEIKERIHLAAEVGDIIGTR